MVLKGDLAHPKPVRAVLNRLGIAFRTRSAIIRQLAVRSMISGKKHRSGAQFCHKSANSAYRTTTSGMRFAPFMALRDQIISNGLLGLNNCVRAFYIPATILVTEAASTTSKSSLTLVAAHHVDDYGGDRLTSDRQTSNSPRLLAFWVRNYILFTTVQSA